MSGSESSESQTPIPCLRSCRRLGVETRRPELARPERAALQAARVWDTTRRRGSECVTATRILRATRIASESLTRRLELAAGPAIGPGRVESTRRAGRATGLTAAGIAGRYCGPLLRA